MPNTVSSNPFNLCDWFASDPKPVQTSTLPPPSQPCGSDIQDAIKFGATDFATKYLTPAIDVNKPLPNGEMPLHFAIRTNQPEIVGALLAHGADPEIKDFQNLSAIDHAVLMGSENILATIIGKKIGTDLKEVQEQIKCKGSAIHVNQLQSKLQNISTVDVKSLSPASKAAYQGDLEKLSKDKIDALDAKGLAPMHYAILGKQLAAVNKLIELGADVKLLSREGESLLHFAALSGSPEILQRLIDLKLNLNSANSKGATPLHYAAAKENLRFAETLIKAGANPTLLDNQGMSPLALFGTSAYQRDPLSLSPAQSLLFASTTLFWLSTMAVAGGWVSSESARYLVLGSAVVVSSSEFGLLVTNLDKSWKKTVAWLGFLGLAVIPPLNVGFQAWRTYHVARSALDGLKKCWSNVGYRNGAVARNVVVYSVNTANSFHSLYQHCKAGYEFCLIGSYLFKMWATRNDEDAYHEAYQEYLRFMKDRYKIGDDPIDVSQCEDIHPSTLAGLSTLDRLRKPELNPQCPEHALMMISPSFTMEALKKEGASLYKGAFRQLMRTEVHPDKAGSSEEVKEAAVRLNAASETLKNWVEIHA